jgi:glycerate-2-kinase
MIKHTIPATNKMNSREVVLEVVTDPGNKHVEMRLSGGERALVPMHNGELALNLDNETARALARSILETVPGLRRGR